MERKEDLPLLGFRRKPSKAVCPVPAKVKALCRDRASKRWSTLLTLTKSRIGYKCGMCQRLGEAHWAAFVKYAEAHHKEDFFRVLAPASGVLCCEGRLDGRPCPKNLCIDLRAVSTAACGEKLPNLHMDHTHDVKRICQVWSRALPEHPQSWDEGICGPLVAHLLFGTRDHLLAQNSDRAIWRKQRHDVAGAHYEHTLRLEDIAWPEN